MVLEGEVQFAGWRDSHTGGPLITLRLADSAALEPFRGMTAAKGNQAGQILTAVIVEGGREAAPIAEPVAPSRVPKAEHGPGSEMANALHRAGWFRSPALWRALHAAGMWTLPQHKRWIESQPCLRRDDQAIRCNGDVVLHHCDTAEIQAAGRELQPDGPQKPPHWYGVPLCHAHHTLWAHGSGPQGASKEEKRALHNASVSLAATAARNIIKVHLGVDSLRDATPAAMVALADRLGLPIPQAVRSLAGTPR